MKKMFVFVVLVLCLTFGLAYGDFYKERFVETEYRGDWDGDLRVISRTTWVDYDNDDRHSTYDYRHGYSYRATRDYFEDRFEFEDERSWKSRHLDDFGKRSYYEYVPYLRDYEERECYVSPPRDKLFYVKC